MKANDQETAISELVELSDRFEFEGETYIVSPLTFQLIGQFEYDWKRQAHHETADKLRDYGDSLTPSERQQMLQEGKDEVEFRSFGKWDFDIDESGNVVKDEENGEPKVVGRMDRCLKTQWGMARMLYYTLRNNKDVDMDFCYRLLEKGIFPKVLEIVESLSVPRITQGETDSKKPASPQSSTGDDSSPTSEVSVLPLSKLDN